MPENSLQVPENLSFPDAIALTQILLDRFSDLADADIESTVTALVATENGARGFFVTYLSNDRSLADHPSAAIVTALRSSPDIVSELLVKNLAMSAAMAVHHRRNQDESAAQGSDRVQRRSLDLIRLLDLPQMRDLAQKLHESAATGRGEYKAFLDRWNYDAEQRQTIEQAVSAVM
ncbi:hypothetical protein H6F67_20920 [Microcoleus sp. FACHB-1515]|uniref:hypothetical protein n=1 Tax=Cyanophyceae TaxID=3028117 RepID=UPI0016899F56|nr:hypothetical protein [Microcoleus sp. FACHB-1515]MBD2092315.1 hypothetical protein [Microcoleus sp. FACHB-1515]